MISDKLQEFLNKNQPNNILTYLDAKKPFFGIPYAYCRWYVENPEYSKWFLFRFMYERISMLNTR